MTAPAKACSVDCPSARHVPDSVRQKGIGCARYGDWLERQSQNCRKRDSTDQRKPIEEYREAIHQAVIKSKGLDYYTGQPLEWNRLNHDKPEGGGQRNHRITGRYPSIDHYRGINQLDYRICAGSVNHAKGALDHQQFVELCRHVVEHHRDWGKP